MTSNASDRQSGVTQAREATKAIRETVKWLTAAFAAVGAALVAGIPLSRITSVDGIHLVVAALGVLLTLGPIFAAIRLTTDVLMPIDINLHKPNPKYSSRADELGKQLSGNTKNGTIAALMDEYKTAASVRNGLMIDLTAPDSASWTQTQFAIWEAGYNIATNKANMRYDTLDAVAATVGYWELRDAFRALRTSLIRLASLAVLGIVVFTFAANLGSSAVGAHQITANFTITPDNVVGGGSKSVFKSLGAPIGPYEPGENDRIEAQPGADICNSDLVKAIADQIKGKQLQLLMVVGSADKFELHPSLLQVYGSNEGLAQARSDRISACLANYVPSELILSSIRGPSIYGSGKSSKGTAGDRSVVVYAIWSETPELNAGPRTK